MSKYRYHTCRLSVQCPISVLSHSVESCGICLMQPGIVFHITLPPPAERPEDEVGGWRQRMNLWFEFKSYSFPLWRSNGGGFCNNFSRSSSTSRGIWRRLAWGSVLMWRFYWGLIICCENLFELLKPFLLSCQLGAERFQGSGIKPCKDLSRGGLEEQHVHPYI